MINDNEIPKKEIFEKLVKCGWDKLTKEEKQIIGKYKEHGYHVRQLATLFRCAGFGGNTIPVVGEDPKYQLNEPHWKLAKDKKLKKYPRKGDKLQDVTEKEFQLIRQQAAEGMKVFIDWYYNLCFIKHKDYCCYCGIKQKDLHIYFNDKNEQYKEARQRGKWLEVERLITAPKEKNLYCSDNCKLACYICNNAKSDFISPKDFKPIAEGINKFWQEKLKDNPKAVEDLKVFWEHQKDNKDIFKG